MQPESSWGAGRAVDAASPPSLGCVRVSLEQQQELQRRRRCHLRGQAGLQHTSLEHSNVPKGQTCYPPRYRLDNTVENPNTRAHFGSLRSSWQKPHTQVLGEPCSSSPTEPDLPSQALCSPWPPSHLLLQQQQDSQPGGIQPGSLANTTDTNHSSISSSMTCPHAKPASSSALTQP